MVTPTPKTNSHKLCDIFVLDADHKILMRTKKHIGLH